MDWKPISEPIPEGAKIVTWDGMDFYVHMYAWPQGKVGDYQGVTHWAYIYPPPSERGSP